MYQPIQNFWVHAARFNTIRRAGIEAVSSDLRIGSSRSADLCDHTRSPGRLHLVSLAQKSHPQVQREDRHGRKLDHGRHRHLSVTLRPCPHLQPAAPHLDVGRIRPQGQRGADRARSGPALLDHGVKELSGTI